MRHLIPTRDEINLRQQRSLVTPHVSRFTFYVSCLLLVYHLLPAAPSPKMPVVSKWGRFEQSFKSSLVYSHPLQDARFTVVFTSPLGETSQVYGFWDGGKTWRVRFSPNQPGRWSFRTTCSDATNQGLHNRSGQFICSAATGTSRFNQHGLVRVALDRRHLEHADGTPFFWLGDTVWNGARVSDPKDWELYARTRSTQKFTVAQWAVAPGQDAKRETAFTGQDTITVNPGFFKRLEPKLETLSRAGLLSAIVPLGESASLADTAAALPDDQAVLFVRYVVARWGADPVAWLLAFDGGDQAAKAARWKKIGDAAFAQSAHAPVILYAGQPELLEQFRGQHWVDGVGLQTLTDLSDDAVKSALAGSLASEWKKDPARPLISFVPCENGVGDQSKKRFSAEEVRRAAYWSLLLTAPAGLSYAGQGVTDWDTTTGGKLRKPSGSKTEDLPAWHKALFMPAARQMAHLASFMDSMNFWRLRPRPDFVGAQPGAAEPRRYLAAAATEAKDIALVYVPEDRTLEIMLEALPPSPSVSWLNPRTGENSPAVAVVGERSCQFPTPDPGDWLLVMKAGK
jgi:hypothetical protein